MRHKFNLGNKVRFTFKTGREKTETITGIIERIDITGFSEIRYKIRDGEWTGFAKEEELEAVK